MARPNPKNSSGKHKSSGRSRKLRFDILEDRRLLAGIDVFVFDDLDGSRFFNSSKDGALSDRAVYVDLDNDGKFASSEPWAVSDSRGVARFPNLEPGLYSVRLLGTNKTVVQTFPTSPANQGVWSDALNITKVLSVDSSGSTWGISGNKLVLVNIATKETIQSIGFGTSTVIDAVLDQSSNGIDSSGYVLSRNQDQSQVLWRVTSTGSGSKQITNVDVATATDLVAVGDKVLVLGGGNLKEISLSQSANATEAVFLKSIGVSGLPPNAVVNSAGPNRFLVFENGGSNRLSLYQFRDGINQLVGKRSFPSQVLSWDVSSDGANIAVSTQDDFMILSPEPGLRSKAVLQDAAGPFVFDPIRNLLITGTESDPSQLTGWSTSNWSKSFSVPVANGETLTGTNASLHLNAMGTQLVGSQGGRLYQQSIATAAAAIATVAGSGITQLQIGVRSTGANRKPDLNDLETLFVDEDGQISIDTARLQTRSSDLDGDSMVYLIRTNPSNGTINWSQDASGLYLPSANANGQDAITIQAYDGRDWSVTQLLPIVINPINDAPSGIALSVDSIPENPEIGEALLTLRALDPDTIANYEYQVDDARFSVVDGILRLVNGTINFEEEPRLVLTVTAIDRLNPQDFVTRSITLALLDVNEAPTGVLSPGRTSIPELMDDVELGRITVIDQDANEQYSWTISDSRFEVVNGMLRLSKGSTLDFEREPSLALRLRGQDGRGQFEIETSVTVSVTDQDDEPIGLALTSSATIRENEPGRRIGSVTVLDPDLGEVYSFSVDDGRFEVVRGTIKLKNGISVSYLEPGFFDLTVAATSLRTGSRVSGKLRLNIERDPTPYHNDVNPYDVNGDGDLTPLDPLVLINYINDKGVGPISAPGEGEDSLPDLDVDGDGEVSPIDILILINKLNEQNEQNGEDVLKLDARPPTIVGEGEGSFGTESGDVLVQPKPGTLVGKNLSDASLTSYLFDLSEEADLRKLRRR